MCHKKIIFFSILLFLAFFANAKNAMALDVTAASCSAAAIQAAINTVANGGGGTVTLPTCDWSSPDPLIQNGALWGSGSKICIASTDPIRVLGQGENLTKLGYTRGATVGYAGVVCPGGNGSLAQGVPLMVRGIGVKEIGQFSFEMNKVGSILYWQQCMGATAAEKRSCTNGATDVRFHHVTLTGSWGHPTYFCQNWRGVTVFDHITIKNTENYSGMYGLTIIGGWEEESFEVPVAFGTNNGLFIEDSVFDGMYHPIAGFYATRRTIRHNTFQNTVGYTGSMSAIESHEAGYTSGCEYGDPVEQVGAYRNEVYDNTWNAGAGVYLRNGFWLITDNTFNTGGITPTLGMGNRYPARTNCTIELNCPWAYTGFTTSEDCFQLPKSWIWNNGSASVDQSDCVRLGTEILLRAPQTGDPYYAGGTWAKYTYPHPLTLGGTPPADTTPPAPPSGVTVN